MDDIDYMDREAKILSESPLRNNSMLFKKGNEPTYQINQHNLALFPFYKTSDRSKKIDLEKRTTLFPPNETEDTGTMVLKKNLRSLLCEIDDLMSIQHLVQSKNNIQDIRRCILQMADKDKMNKPSVQTFGPELILETLVLKYQKLNSSNTALKAFVQDAFNDYY
jgi:hypothetical protein